MMMRTTGKKFVLYMLVLLAAGFLPLNCGKKAPPRPPGEKGAPAAAVTLSHTVAADVLQLKWSLVEKPDAAASGVAGFYVYRSRMRLPDAGCPGCPVLFERIAEIPRDSGEKPSGPFTYQERLERGYRYIYKVGTYRPGGAAGSDSNTIEFRN